MDSFHADKLKIVQAIIEDLGLEDETTSHTTPQDEVEGRERKRHIPSVTTVSRSRRALSGDRQAHRRSEAEQDGREAPQMRLPTRPFRQQHHWLRSEGDVDPTVTL